MQSARKTRSEERKPLVSVVMRGRQDASLASTKRPHALAGTTRLNSHASSASAGTRKRSDTAAHRKLYKETNNSKGLSVDCRMSRRLAPCLGLALGVSLLYYSGTASAHPSLEVSTTLGGSDASEYLVRVANPDSTEARGVIELRRNYREAEHPLARAHFEVPAKTTRYFRIPGEKGSRLSAVAVMGDETVLATERYVNEGTIVLFDIPPSDEKRLHELRVHDGPHTVITHASFDDATKTPVLTRRAAVYDGASLVLVPSSVFLALPAAEREALTAWVRTGGAMAVSISKESDRAYFTDGEYGLGYMHILAFDPWSAESNGNVDIQEKLVKLAENDRSSARAYNEPWSDMPTPSLDPNQGYRGVLPIAGVLLVIQALVTALAFRRLAARRGMGPAYRFVAGSSVAAFTAVIGLGIYAKGGFAARARELSFAQAASGESVAWVQRNRTYFASSARTIEVAPRDPANVIDAHGRGGLGDSRAMLRVNDGDIVLSDVDIRPWQTTSVWERGITTIGGGVTIEPSADGRVTVRNRVGTTLHNVVVVRPDGICVSFTDIPNGESQTSSVAGQFCASRGPDWANYRQDRNLHHYTLLGEMEEAPTTVDGFRLEKRTTLLRVTGGES